MRTCIWSACRETELEDDGADKMKKKAENMYEALQQ